MNRFALPGVYSLQIMRRIPRQQPMGEVRTVVVDRERLEVFRTPPWWSRRARFAISGFALALALCLHAVAVAAVAVWQKQAPVEILETHAVTVLPEIPPVEAFVAPPDSSGDGTGERAAADAPAVEQAVSVSSNYWDQVRAAIAGRVRYPRAAVLRRVEGTVDLQLTVDRNGSLRFVAPLNAPPESLAQAAVDAARRAAPFPANTNGACEVASVILPVHFLLKQKPERRAFE